MKKKLFRGSLFLLLITVMLLSASCGKNRATTMKLIKTDGDVGVENEKGKSVDLIENLGLYSGYGIGTQTESFAWIDLDDTKLTKMDEKSDVDIKKDGKKLELVVNSGGLFFNVTKPLEEDESMDIRTSTTICGIRGTCGWVESRGDTTYVGLFEGKVECTVIVDGKGETVRVNAKELLIVKKDGDNVTYEIKELKYKDVPEFVQIEIADEPFALEEELHTVDDFLGVYSNSDGENTRDVVLGLDDDGALYFSHGNSINQSYSSYEVDGNIITATYQDETGTYTDTFTLNEDSSLTTEFGDEDLKDLNMTFVFESEINEEELRQAAYQAILDEYTEAADLELDGSNGDFKQLYGEQYPNVNSYIMNDYLNPPKPRLWDLYYAYYDIDGNGADELLIGSGGGHVLALYAFDGRQAVKAVTHESAYFSIYTDGMICETIVSVGGGEHVFKRIADDGYTMEVEHTYTSYFDSYYKDNEQITREEYWEVDLDLIDSDSIVKDFEWNDLVAKDRNYEQEETSDVVDISEYLGTFINGEDSGMGMLTISEIDSQTVNVRFEACRDFGNGNGLSVVFEETGYPFENGIYIDVSGQRIEFTKGTQRLGAQSYVLNVPETLKQEWELLESVYEMEYILEEKWREYYSGLDY